MGEISSLATKRCHSFTLYQGTFIQLPREPTAPASSRTAPVYELQVNDGVVWVDNSDGRIAGFDWAVRGQEELDKLAASMGWKLAYNDNEVESTQATVVRVVRSRAEKNGFFFPGFIGKGMPAASQLYMFVQRPKANRVEQTRIFMRLNTRTPESSGQRLCLTG